MSPIKNELISVPGERNAIGISFGNSNSSIAYTTGVSSICPERVVTLRLS